MSWLTNHIFGSSKSEDDNKDEVPSSTTDQDTVCAMTNEQDSTKNRTETDANDPETLYEKREVAAEWQVPLRGKLHKIEFEHGTTSGKRVLWIDKQEIFRRDWMFKLVGDDVFQLDDLRCVLRVDPAPGFKYKYSLFVDSKPLEQFKQRQAKALRIWEAAISDKTYRVVLEKETLNIFLNGTLREEDGEFTDTGTETIWETDGNNFILSAKSSGNKQDGLIHSLTINGIKIDEVPISE